ncbi:type II secretion system F family protein [Bacillus canaveralius]|uniref:Type II secretion system F family protein n=1 Tax=Bacillus canaveralius TaxID=1403243 RepID=A0A2N5GQ29_9BACI|nr:type II secretion system F family protein [Bacillus canaveralius]PLR84984.1 type II secretion system F family protein [Bacillus canaveralius]PLR93245.1 type II secretion system F family protein [Bacillus canaveralius]RSK52445.1 type II secretion system F family protein [Bacillus canaveralius]
MPRFKYSGRDRKGKKSGVVTAGSRREALLQLKENGIRTLEIAEIPETVWTKELTISNPVKLQDFVIYLRQFSTLLRAGVPVVEATAILSQQTESKALKKALIAAEQDLREGNPLSEAVGRHKRIFTSMFVNMIKAGEAGGNLDDTLERLAVHFEKQHFTKQKIISALAYPITVGIIAIAVVIFLLVSVVPTFVDMFADFGGELPAITQFVLNSSEWIQRFWWLVILLFIVAFTTVVMMRNNKEAKYYLDFFVLKMPLFGKILQKAALARMTRTLSSLFASSVPILQALSMVENIVGNEVIARVIRKSRNSLEQGKSLTEPMRAHWVFPPLVSQMIAIGEETGALDSMLAKVADFYEKEVESSTDRLKSLIEPLMIVILAALVGTIVIAIIVPMFEIFQQVE